MDGLQYRAEVNRADRSLRAVRKKERKRKREKAEERRRAIEKALLTKPTTFAKAVLLSVELFEAPANSSVCALQQTDERLVRLTNLSRSLYEHFVAALNNDASYRCRLAGRPARHGNYTPTDEQRSVRLKFTKRNVLIVAQRLFTAMPLHQLGIFWSLDKSVISRICEATLPIMADHMRVLMITPLKNVQDLHALFLFGHHQAFRSRFPRDLRDGETARFYLLADCFPLHCGGSSDPELNRKLYGSKYSSHCFKQLIVSLPNGTPLLIPPLLPGVATDADVINAFNIVPLLEAMAKMLAKMEKKPLKSWYSLTRRF
jgi:hypothetical protein